MYEVLARVPLDITRRVASRGVRVDSLFDGLSFSLADLEDKYRRVAWDDFALLLDRAAAALGGPEAMEAVAEETIEGFEYYRGLAALFVDPEKLYELGCTKLSGTLYGPAVRCWCRSTRDRQLHAGYEIVGSRRSSMAFAHGSLAAMRVIPCHLGLEPAAVTATLGPRRAEFTVTLPPSCTIPSRIRAGGEWVGRLVDGLFTDHVHDLNAAVDESAVRRIEDRSEADGVAARTHALAVRVMGCTDLTEYQSRVRALIEDELQLGLIGLWRVEELEQRPLERGEGATVGLRWQLPLLVDGREVGRLELREGEAEPAVRALALVEEVLPLLALGLQNASSHEELRARASALENQVRAWEQTLLSSLVALEAIAGQAFVITGAGDVLASNEAGRAALESLGEELREELRHAATGRTTDIALTPLGPPGLTPGRMLAVRRNVASELEGRTRVAALRWKLTKRQTEVLSHVVRGRSNKEIACLLGCAEGTVEIHITQMLRRAGSDSRGTLTARFWTEG